MEFCHNTRESSSALVRHEVACMLHHRQRTQSSSSSSSRAPFPQPLLKPVSYKFPPRPTSLDLTSNQDVDLSFINVLKYFLSESVQIPRVIYFIDLSHVVNRWQGYYSNRLNRRYSISAAYQATTVTMVTFTTSWEPSKDQDDFVFTHTVPLQDVPKCCGELRTGKHLKEKGVLHMYKRVTHVVGTTSTAKPLDAI